MNTSRREFMALAAASAAVLVAGSARAAEAVGDGIADDTAAIQAVLDRGEVFEPKAGHERYRTTRTLHIRKNGAGLRGCVIAPDLPDGVPGIRVSSGVPAFSMSNGFLFNS